MSEHIIVPAVGPEQARVMLIGEAPGETEVKKGEPFVGMAGKVLDDILAEVGLHRSEVRITNVIQRRPPGNRFAVFYEKRSGKLAPTVELAEAYRRLQDEILICQPNVIVPLGAEAFKAVTGKQGILDWRGSVLSTPLGKVIPTIHPAAILRQWNYRPAVISDFHKIVSEMGHPDLPTHERTLITTPTFKEVQDELKRIKEKGGPVAFDIEVETEQITCIGLSDKIDYAICIPFWFGASGSLWTEEEEASIWQGIREILEDESIGKIAHNGSYDIEYLRRTMDINVRGFKWDTMLLFHTLYPELPKSLAYLVSIYTDHPFYKYQRKASTMADYWKYNATDACLTYECHLPLIDELREVGLEDFYDEYVHSLVEPLLDMSMRGVRLDWPRLLEARKEYRERVASLKETLNSQVGHELNPASHKQMTSWLYDELKLPKHTKKRKATGETTLAADEEALNDLYTKHKVEALRTVLEIREANKILSTYLEVKLDEDKRIRCSYNITGTETGRLSSSATARGTGTNLQNIPDGIVKSLFIPDEGCTFVNADLSQAEARVVAHLSGEDRLIAVFEEGGDIHRKNAANIYRVAESEVTDDQRTLAKRVVHASNYGMGPRTFSKTVGIPESEAKRLLNQYFATYPRIRTWHMDVRSQLQRSRKLVTPLGRKRTFFNRWGDSVLKEGLAFVPQSTVADLLNSSLVLLRGRLALADYNTSGLWKREILLTVHDSILVQCPEAAVEDTISIMRRCLERPIDVNGRVFVIPVDFKTGSNWRDMKSWMTR